MHILLLALAFLPGIAAEEKDPARPEAAPRAAAQCSNAETHRVGTLQNPVRPGTLGDQPRADQYLAVVRLENGCDKPIKVGQNIERRR